MKIFEFPQGTTEWHAIRHGKIGGSTAAKLMTKLDKPITDVAEFNSVLGENMEDFDELADLGYVSSSMQRGIELEPYARKEFCRIHDKQVDEYGWIEMDNEFIGISPDGWNKDENFSIEIKCPKSETHVKYLRDFNQFLEDYVWQIVHYFTVLDIKTLYCISYRPENKYVPLIVHPVTKETRISISKKESYTISELSIMELTRLLSCKNAIIAEITKQELVNQF